MSAAGDRLRLVQVADTMDHHRDDFFGGLAEIGFHDRADTVMVSSVFAKDENAHDVSRYQLETMKIYVSKYKN